ncbi:hypothetical protein [Picosynechococcus sp. PCC 11901]|uniref:hypothetical protein n=1 Tax=Picosynechococcus sp. PCC 11901 TaxID=2579791 RepID=UPI0015E87C88|nr:hypothetical protein [Picosynechococcus sp. PCC 11901]
MTKPTLNSSDSLPTPDSGAMDSLWRPSWLHWLISALSGTVEIEKQTAWLKKSNEELRQSNKEARIAHEQRLKMLREENARLAELESKLDAVLPKYNSSSTQPTETDGH